MDDFQGFRSTYRLKARYAHFEGDLETAPVAISNPGAGAKCQSCGDPSEPSRGALFSFLDPTNIRKGRIEMHASCFKKYAEARNLDSQGLVKNDSSGKTIVIQIFADKQ